MSELSIRVRKQQDNGSSFRATPDNLYLGGVRSAKVDKLKFELPEEWAACAVTLHVQRLSGTLPDPQALDAENCVEVDRRWTLEKQGTWMLLAVGEGGYIAMTKPAQYTCYETIDTDSTTETIDPSVYEQFVDLVLKSVNEAKNAAKQTAEDRAATAGSAEKAATSEGNAKESETKSKASEEAAAKSESAAKASKEAAAKSEANALKYSQEAGAKAGTDKTLSIPDAPADAKQVGDALAVMYTKEEIQKLIEDSLAAYRAEEYAKIKYWISDDPTSPAELFGGTWEQIKDKFILGASDAYPAGSTGGEAEVTLIEDQLPVIDGTWMCPVPNNHVDVAVTGHAYGYDHNTSLASWWGSGSDGIRWGYGYKFGGGMPHNNLPPYYSMYIWRRVA